MVYPQHPTKEGVVISAPQRDADRQGSQQTGNAERCQQSLLLDYQVSQEHCHSRSSDNYLRSHQMVVQFSPTATILAIRSSLLVSSCNSVHILDMSSLLPHNPIFNRFTQLQLPTRTYPLPLPEALFPLNMLHQQYAPLPISDHRPHSHRN